MRCPACARERTKVRTLRSAGPQGAVVTQALIAINVIVFIVELASGARVGGAQEGTVYLKGALYGPAITHQHEYWRILTAGFLHYSLLHIAFNMFFLYIMAGSFGALLFEPGAHTVGASGACFGVLGALLAVARARRISIWRTGLGPTLLINIVFSLSVAGISIGGHLGGLIGGLIAGQAVVELGERRGQQSAALAGCALVALVSFGAAIAVAGSHGLTPNGLTFGGS
jgi:membrane associated rhomboid family serine protease